VSEKAGLGTSLALLVHRGSLRPNLMTAVQREVQQGRDHDDKAGNQCNRYDPDPVGDKHGDSSMQKAVQQSVRVPTRSLARFRHLAGPFGTAISSFSEGNVNAEPAAEIEALTRRMSRVPKY
jgi:hypothetical protein